MNRKPGMDRVYPPANAGILVRVGPYRIIYKVDDEHQEVVIGKVARYREDTYKVVEDLF